MKPLKTEAMATIITTAATLAVAILKAIRD